jgi:RimJ/RimL family protein N-acetyltransferase
MFDYQPQLHGEWVDMRPVHSSDFDALYALGSNPAVWEQHPDADRYLEPVFRAYFNDGLASQRALVAVRRADRVVIGWSRYSTEFAAPDEVEIGWTFLGVPYWGGRYNRDMKRVMIAHAFRYVPRVIFRIGERNTRSRRAVERLGATVVDTTSGKVRYAIARDGADR